MSKLNVEDREVRFLLYREALKLMESKYPLPGICYAISLIAVQLSVNNSLSSDEASTLINNGDVDVYRCISHHPCTQLHKFPELAQRKPGHIKNASSFWFPPWEKEPRINILKSILIEDL